MKQVKKHENNPFLKELNGVMYVQPRGNYILKRDEKVISSDGEILKENMVMGRQKFVDKSEFSKIYVKSMAQIMELKPNTVKVIMYLTSKIDYENKAYLNCYDDYTKLGYKTYKSVHRGLLELVEHSMIAAALYPHFWWVNPLLICKRERFAVYQEYIKDKGGTYGDAVNNITKGKHKFEQLKLFDSNNQPIRQEIGTYEKKAKGKN